MEETTDNNQVELINFDWDSLPEHVVEGKPTATASTWDEHFDGKYSDAQDADVENFQEFEDLDYVAEWMWPDGSFRPVKPPMTVQVNQKTYMEICKEWDEELAAEAAKEAAKETETETAPPPAKKPKLPTYTKELVYNDDGILVGDYEDWDIHPENYSISPEVPPSPYIQGIDYPASPDPTPEDEANVIEFLELNRKLKEERKNRDVFAHTVEKQDAPVILGRYVPRIQPEGLQQMEARGKGYQPENVEPLKEWVDLSGTSEYPIFNE